MAHQHTVSDTDKHFTINPETREIINESGKITLIQNDHNSERLTFDIPMLVDGHDMSKCNVVQVHYLNVEGVKDGMIYEGLYEIDDLQANGDTVSGSWLISRNATQFAGQLNFVIHYQCVADDGTVDYAWSTAIHTGIVVSDGIQNNEVAVSQYTDVLEQWRKTLVLANVVTQYTPEEARAALGALSNEDGAVNTSNISDGSVTRSKLARDALYSPHYTVSTVSYSISGNDLGKSLYANASGKDIVITLPLSASQNLPAGAEIAIFYIAGASVKIVFDSEIQSAIVGDTAYNLGRTYSIPERFGVCALKKIGEDSSKTNYWVVTGNVEVVK